MSSAPIPENELNRILNLSDFDLDYYSLEDNFKDLTRLAAKALGAPISLVNLIDSFTQWTVASHGMDLKQMPREDSVCQYTILKDEAYKIDDLTTDERYKDKIFTDLEGNRLKYYFGVPLTTNDGYNIGALCILDNQTREIDPEKVEFLKIIAKEIINRLTALKVIKSLKYKLEQADQVQKKVAHDIRGPIGGIIGLAQIISEQGDQNKLDEVLEFVQLIQKSGTSLLELADEILTANKAKKLNDNELNLLTLKDKLEKLYNPQAVYKNINFKVNINKKTEDIPFSKDKLLQIIGNLISNAMKFTSENGAVTVDLDIISNIDHSNLLIKVKDNGVGISKDRIDAILNGEVASTNGTQGEAGYGFGLALVKHLIDSLKGTLEITSVQGEGTTFTISLPQKANKN
ncbi:GAF domain-containing sensor histidine kinase [Pedobacter glucosidilyticus]|uniref:GAF domain-containing sensor histidine kinase n=1 Tax=Pedobacter glucosidilyticus TaxID=1122941 RepID=UPI00041A85B0|nr:GAF domain-containing sensor histidine kinase [Pedobacter glucosidilyticus]